MSSEAGGFQTEERLQKHHELFVLETGRYSVLSMLSSQGSLIPFEISRRLRSLSVVQISYLEWVASFCAHGIPLSRNLCIQLLADPLRYTVGQVCIGKLCHISGTDLWSKTVAAEHLTWTLLMILPICIGECSFHCSFISEFKPFQNANIRVMGISGWCTAKACSWSQEKYLWKLLHASPSQIL